MTPAQPSLSRADRLELAIQKAVALIECGRTYQGVQVLRGLVPCEPPIFHWPTRSPAPDPHPNTGDAA